MIHFSPWKSSMHVRRSHFDAIGRLACAVVGYIAAGRTLGAALAALMLPLSPGTLTTTAQALDARAVALGGAVTALPSHFWGDENPASWAGVRHPGVGAGVVQLFGMPELRAASSLLVWPVGRSALAAGITSFGYDLYRETQFLVGSARALHAGTHRLMYAGAALRWHHVRIRGYGQASAGTATVGVILPLIPAVTIGAAAANVVVGAGSLRPELRRSLAAGVSFSHEPYVTLAMDVLKELRSPGSFRLGAETRPAPLLALRAGVTTDPARASTGIGIRTRHFQMDAAAERHAALGWSPVLSVVLRW